MNLDYVPLMRVMRELHDIPRGQPPDFNGMKRFRQYLRTIFPNDERDKGDIVGIPAEQLYGLGSQ